MRERLADPTAHVTEFVPDVLLQPLGRKLLPAHSARSKSGDRLIGIGLDATLLRRGPHQAKDQRQKDRNAYGTCATLTNNSELEQSNQSPAGDVCTHPAGLLVNGPNLWTSPAGMLYAVISPDRFCASTTE